MPGELARSFKVHAEQAHKAEEFEAQHRVEAQHIVEDREQEEAELHHREERVLAELAEREELLREEAQRLDDRAIKLDDGRRAYVDGDCYRDNEGHELTGADRAQAEVLHVEHPNATSWQEEQQLTRKWEETQRLRHGIEAAQAGAPGTDEATAIGAAEKMLAQPNQQETLKDYGNADRALTAASLKM